MSERISSPSQWVLISAILAGMGLFCAPSDLADKVRGAVRDALHPGQMVASRVREWTTDSYQATRNRIQTAVGSPPVATTAAGDDERIQQLFAENALLREQLLTAKSSAHPSQSSDPLLVPEVVDARVLGEEAVQHAGRSIRSLLGSGANNGVETAAFVLSGRGSQIDLGTDSQMKSDHLVLCGRAVVGKVGQVGRFTSTLMPITDKQYRGLARLARPAGNGLEFGAEGILEGDGGDACRLNFIQSTEPVSVGDSIFTVDSEGSLGVPLLYGTVVEAELPTGAPHWTIRVKPAADKSKLRVVQIIKRQVNPVRLSAQ